MTTGDIVELKHGEKFPMMIATVVGETAECNWREGDQMRTGLFFLDALEPARELKGIESIPPRHS
jgi:uncharacterized protein YodC (DUF2158 family)